MKKIENYSDKLLMFEIARLRTLFKSKPEFTDRIVKRYKLIVDEYNNRNLRWMWSKHILDELIKEDWCTEKGGKWITVEGKHICISNEKEIKEGVFERKLIGKENDAKLVYEVGRRETANKAAALYNTIPDKFKSKIKEIDINRESKKIGDIPNLPEEYAKYKDRVVGASWKFREGKITVYKTGTYPSLVHEFGHGIYESGEVSGYYNIWKKEKVSSYGSINANEGFAEAFKHYKTNPSRLKQSFPETSKFMENLFGGEK